jgi:hypothetical protein
MTPITYDVQLTADDYLDALRLHRRRVYWFGRFRFAYWGTFLFLLIALGLMGSGPSAWTTPGLLLFFVAALAFLTDRLLLPRQARRIYRQQQSLQRPFRLTVTDDGIQAVSASFTGSHAWSDYRRWIEGRDQFLLYQSDVLFLIIPKRSVPRSDDLRGILSEKIRRASSAA